VDKSADPRLAFDEKLAREKKFVVTGSVVCADGQTPLEGVEVWAVAGDGTLRPTGETRTDKDGRFRLVFRAGILLAGGKAGGTGIIHVRKPGWYGWSYGRRSQFTLSDQPLDPRDVPAKTTNLVPGTPSPLEFRMERAASFSVKLTDGAGRPMPNTRVWLTGNSLPPGSSVLAAGKTDAAGFFAVADVPRSSFRLVIEDAAPGRGELELGSIQFQEAAEYHAVATVRAWGPQTTDTSLKVIRGRDRQLP
jgi:hypothetical protein